MKAYFTTWGPITVLAVLAVLLVVGGGVVNVIVDDSYSYRQYLDDLKYVAAALAAGAGVGRGLVKMGDK